MFEEEVEVELIRCQEILSMVIETLARAKYPRDVHSPTTGTTTLEWPNAQNKA